MTRAGQRALLRSREIQTKERRSVEAKGGHPRLVLVELDRRPAELGADDAGVQQRIVQCRAGVYGILRRVEQRPTVAGDDLERFPAAGSNESAFARWR